MTSRTVTCPSGMVATVRGLKVADQRLLAGKGGRASTADTMDALLKSCVVEVHDPGIYQFGAAPDWSKVLTGDRTFLYVQIGAATYGPTYDCKPTCPECRARFGWRIDVDTDLQVKQLPDESKATLAAGGLFETILAGPTIRFRLMTGGDERRLAGLLRGAGDDKLAVSIAYRIDSVDALDGRAKKAWIDDLGFADLMDLMARMNEADCGVDGKLDVQCPECSAEVEIEIPFGPEYLMREKKKAA